MKFNKHLLQIRYHLVTLSSGTGSMSVRSPATSTVVRDRNNSARKIREPGHRVAGGPSPSQGVSSSRLSEIEGRGSWRTRRRSRSYSLSKSRRRHSTVSGHDCLPNGGHVITVWRGSDPPLGPGTGGRVYAPAAGGPGREFDPGDGSPPASDETSSVELASAIFE